MTQPIIPRDQVAQEFEVAISVLARYEARGLVRVVRAGPVEGYEPAEIRRIWSILSLQRDLGVNLAGVEAILRLRAHVDELHRQLSRLAVELRELVEAPAERDPHG